MHEIWVGMRVKSNWEHYTGTVYYVRNDGIEATVKRDDGQLGGGVDIPGYGRGWSIQRDSKAHPWVSIELIKEGEDVNKIELPFMPGDKVRGMIEDTGPYIGGAKFEGVVSSVRNATTITLSRPGSISEWHCSQRSDGLYGSDNSRGKLTNLSRGETTMASITEKLVNSKLTDNQKVFKENGITDAAGTITAVGSQFVTQYILDTQADAIAKKITELNPPKAE